MRGALRFALLAALLLSACGGAPPAPRPVLLQRADAAALAANRATQSGNDEDAADLWRSALELRTAIDDWQGAGEARLGLAQAQRQLQRPDAAVATLDGMPDAVLYPPSQRARAAYLMALLTVAQPGVARGWLQRARTQCTAPCALAVPLANLDARLLLAEGDPAAALAMAASPVDAPPAERAHAARIRAEALGQLGRPAEGLVQLADAITADRHLAEPAYLADDFALQQRLADAAGEGRLADEARTRLAAICAVARVPACALRQP
ncbi:hypothetical protein [Jeongeupia sp. USM3]|uniref:hypothetical protein n=1 Tax=Jeongeupia sp. USM3 TaxID=1906741 RepID=UPI0011AB3CDC|nr:hypothetical protein [Jeongeupia sp. USM3]